jgi:hypothetical protein
MEYLFIRHKMGLADETIDKLLSERLIAIHFANKRSTNPSDYNKAGKRALRFLWKRCESGAIVGADYGESMLVGEIKPKSKVRLRIIKDKKRGEKLIFKTVKLSRVKRISYLDYPRLKIQPRQITVTGWPSAEEYLERIIHNKPFPFNVSSLAPDQLEVMCYEYLKMRDVVEALLLPIGRQLRDIDIYGIGRGRTVYAQVTHSHKPDEISKKIERLYYYKSRTSTLIFFGPKAQLKIYKGIKYISIEAVFDKLKSNRSSIYCKMLKRMLGR